ncbi:TPA: hypothetical protein DIC20_03915 [Candidatus Dependentiae bacterium]|nr:MAG: hypothetical protein US03_C0001G0170 [candidate division TM6 bacterium GW2011_GWF2_36_131]KKQ03694.1 MAG: hypothetical protein US13_C0001G0034 [candidate division TM6 bacterium GW2011_GWE2_36_25]KKQ20071.1 MAG: hypothetical protein US32_C0002G0076 [candidate division TM6 bacterium GW2011_GWA2_36_9]HBR70461.1 hypothetical protein [Candidatus Dependentiae bacterium]HCU00823.1 hypothetical protein [Candidatus Dependentiae bacterium]
MRKFLLILLISFPLLSKMSPEALETTTLTDDWDEETTTLTDNPNYEAEGGDYGENYPWIPQE